MTRFTEFTLVLLLAALTGSSAFAQSSSDGDEAAIRDLIERTEAANNAGDVQVWVSLFADDAVYMPPGSPPVTTREGLVEVAKAGFRHDADIDIEPVEIRVLGEWAFARTTVSGTVKVADSGEVVTVDVKQIAIYRRGSAGEWRIARLISNSNG